VTPTRALTWAVSIRSASSEQWRGGDVFETFTRQDQSTSILLADISSKSEIARIQSNMLRSAFIRSAEEQRQPSRILSRLNELSFNTSDVAGTVTFASAFVATFSRDAMSVTYASAGHDLAMIIGEGWHRHLAVTGPLLGVFVDPTFAQREEPFDADDLLIVVTDGITECRHARTKALRFGTNVVVRALASAQIDGSCSARDAIVVSFEEFSGRYYRDDATVAIVGRR
jgi:phosphoserine phosphatase RsbU/P